MRNISLILLCLVLLGSTFYMTGCATMGAGLFKTEQVATFYISVTSNPSDAEIYLNEKFVGRTPSKKLPLMVYFIQNNYGLGVHQTVIGQYTLRVSKRGYKNAGMIIPVKNKGFYSPLGRVDEIGLYQTSFHFNLEAESDETRQEYNFNPEEEAEQPQETGI